MPHEGHFYATPHFAKNLLQFSIIIPQKGRLLWFVPLFQTHWNMISHTLSSHLCRCTDKSQVSHRVQRRGSICNRSGVRSDILGSLEPRTLGYDKDPWVGVSLDDSELFLSGTRMPDYGVNMPNEVTKT